jgi:hypothetical protein
MNTAQVVLHFVRTRKFTGADGAGEDLPHIPLVVEEGVTLKGVLVLEGLLDMKLLAFHTTVNSVLH